MLIALRSFVLFWQKKTGTLSEAGFSFGVSPGNFAKNPNSG